MQKSDFKLIPHGTPELRRRSEKSVKMDERKKIYADDEVFAQIKDKSRMAYVKSWKDFKNFNIDFEFEDGHPEEEAIIVFFKHLRLEKKMATSSIWTHYYYINSVMKRKYGWKLQTLPRIIMTMKGFDENQKTRKTTLKLKL